MKNVNQPRRAGLCFTPRCVCVHLTHCSGTLLWRSEAGEKLCFSKSLLKGSTMTGDFDSCADWFLLWQRPADRRCRWGFLHGSPLDWSSDVHGHRERRAGTSLRLHTQAGTWIQILQKSTLRRLWWWAHWLYSLPCVFVFYILGRPVWARVHFKACQSVLLYCPFSQLH